MQNVELVNAIGIVSALNSLRCTTPWDKESIEDLVYVCELVRLDTAKLDYLIGCATVFEDDAELLDSYLHTASELVNRELSRVPKIDLTDTKMLQFVFLLSAAYKQPQIQSLIVSLCSPLAVEVSDEAVSYARTTPAGELLVLMAGAMAAQNESDEVLH